MKKGTGNTCEQPVWLDISRLLYRILRRRITGIDRVEIAYASTLLETVPSRLKFVAYDYWRGTFRMLHQKRAEHIVTSIGPQWAAGDIGALRFAALRGMLETIFSAPPLPYYRGGARPIYINVSMHPLHLVSHIGGMVDRTGALFLPLLHDMIPIEYPEYVPKSWTGHHRERLKTIDKLADGVISNSAFTTQGLSEHIQRVPVLTMPLGVHQLNPSPVPVHKLPYFLVVGTIEPRKNHLLLLHVWRRLVQQYGSVAPQLVVAGHRGWDNEQIVDILERCRDLRGYVHELGMVSDGDLARLMADATALLMPSFVEGYGLPVVEALSLGTPVICSDISAHRQIGAGIPDFIDPLDGAAWAKLIMHYATDPEAARERQMARRGSWEKPSWQRHVASVLEFAEGLTPRRDVSEMPHRLVLLMRSIRHSPAASPVFEVASRLSHRVDSPSEGVEPTRAATRAVAYSGD
ncbi:glycosyltransferase family 4 protein [Acidocella sp.]|jgi:glycosyltransferase involved in cell wall biosynthesis|uniref:glycosyltransferase family 4 protein n=1 Tax=Acidocella sp. TaxID=50710 RepID=UPI002F4105D7